MANRSQFDMLGHFEKILADTKQHLDIQAADEQSPEKIEEGRLSEGDAHLE